MDLANTFLLCFICAGLTCLRSIISQRLRGRVCGSARSALFTNRPSLAKQQASESEAAGSVLSGSALPNTYGSTLENISMIDNNHRRRSLSDSDDSCSVDEICGLSRAVYDSTACSVASTACSSPSNSQGDSDMDSDERSLPSSVECSDDERPTGGLKPVRRHSTFSTPVDRAGLRPAIRLSRSSSLSHPKSTAERRTKTKSVTFEAMGAIICSPPTMEALSLLAAGTPPVPFVMPASCMPKFTKKDYSVPMDDPEQRPVRSADSVVGASASQRRSGRTSPSGTAAGGCNSIGAASTASQRVHVSSDKVAAPLHSVATASPAWATSGANAEPGFLSTDRAHATALARVVVGRQRVMAALEEAKNRFSQLGRNQLWDGAPSAVPGPSTQLEIIPPGPSSSKLQGSHQGSVGKESQVQVNNEAALQKRLPYVPLAYRDVGILSVGYASCAISPHGDSAGPGPGLHQNAMMGCSEVSSVGHHGVSVRNSGNCGGGLYTGIVSKRRSLVTEELASGVLPEPFKGLMALDGVAGLQGLNVIALSHFTSSGRMRLAEVVAKHLQSQHVVSWRQGKN